MGTTGHRRNRGDRAQRRRIGAVALALALVAAACSDDSTDGDATSDDTTAPTVDAPETNPPATDDPPDSEPDPAPTTTPDAEPESDDDDVAPTTDPEEPAAPALVDATIAAGVEQITVTGAEPGTEVGAIAAGDDGTDDPEVLATGTVDDYGSLVLRGLWGGGEHVLAVGDARTDAIDVLRRDDHPDAPFYAEQRLTAPGFGYVETRDGTTLGANVALPGPIEDGPYPTVVEYSGYTPSDPEATGFKDLFTALGYAYVGVNMRGTGCSGGSFRFFEYTQSTDGYDVIEAVAAQPWSANVGMVGVSYPGISQLFVAQTQPPNLTAITPLSVLDDNYRSTLYPGGLLNTGFAVEWTQQRMDDARPAVDPTGDPTGEGQEWAAAQIAGGDETCAANQAVRLQSPDLVAEILDTPFYDPAIGDVISPRLFVDRIEVPTFMAGAWQDEQTGGRFPTMIPEFTGTDRLFVSLVNGLHTESISPGVFPRYVEFLDLYVAERTPSLGAARAVAPVLAQGLFGTDEIGPADDRFADMEYDEALAAFESEPSIRVLFEQGAADGVPPLTPLPRFVAEFDEWPIPGTEARRWYATADGTLSDEAPGASPQANYRAVPDAVPPTFWDGNSSDLWRTDVEWSWQRPGDGTVAGFTSAPLDETLTMVGSASADLWVASSSGDTDIEVTLSEIRPDGTEVYVQSGWLRASHRALDEDESTELRPVQTHLEADAEPLPAVPADDVESAELALARVEIFPFAHVFRPGSRIRVTVGPPGGNRAVWEFDTIVDGEAVYLGVGGDEASSIVLPVVPGVDAPADAPPADSLRGQPSRPLDR